MTIRIPKNLNLSELISQNEHLLMQFGYKNDSRLKDKIAYLCYAIHCSAASHRDWLDNYLEGKELQRPSYPLNAELLRSIITDYKKVKDLSVDLGIIKVSASYETGKTAKKFQFTDTYYGTGYKQYTLNSFVLIKNLKQSYCVKAELEDFNKSHFLRKYWKSGGLTIDIDAAMGWIKKTQQKEIGGLKILDVETLETRIKNINEKYDLHRTSVLRIYNCKGDDYLFCRDSFGQRIYTHLTNLKKELRQFVTYQNETLVSIDLKNSQPYLLLGLFNRSLWEDEKIKKNIIQIKNRKYRKEDEKKIKIEEEIDRICISIMLLERVKNQASKGFEFENFVQLVTSGKIYEYLMEKLGNKYEHFNDRQEVKKEFLRLMYYNNKQRWLPTYTTTRDIENLFPSITKAFDLIKEDGYKNLPLILQSLERYLIIDVICKRIHSIDSKISLFCIHDSIVTTEKYQLLVETIMTEELTKAIGHKPTMSLEKWQQNNPLAIAA